MISGVYPIQAVLFVWQLGYYVKLAHCYSSKREEVRERVRYEIQVIDMKGYNRMNIE